MKILCFIDSLGSGGAQRQMVELAKGFKEKGHNVSFLTYHNVNFFKPELDKFNIPVKTIIEANNVKRLFKIRKAIRKNKPDALLSFLAGANFMATVAGFPYRQWKLVVGERSANPAIVNNIKLRFYRKMHFFSDYIVGNSHKNIELVKKIIPSINKKKLKVIYNSVEILKENDFVMSESDITNIVIAASYRPVKNLDGLIGALQILPQGYVSKLKINWYGNISADKNYYLLQQDRINQLGLSDILILRNETYEIHKEFLKADFVGLFSHYEGFPNSICEAMAMSKPVIVSKVSDVPLFVKENKNGFLCESNQSESIKSALISAIESSSEQRKEMGENNSIIAKQVFNRDIIVEAYLRIFLI
jgi:glycosyltransferase involved in cell wall biosynthesis